jgi:hypothetical protein
MKKPAFICVFLLCLIESLHCIFIHLGSKEKRCVYQKTEKGVKYTGKYFVTGVEETANKVYISNSKKERIWVSDFKKEGSFSFYPNEASTYALCFASESTKSITVSFDIFKGNDDDSLVSVQSIKELNKNIHEIRKRVDIIHSDMRSSLVRRSGHLESKFYI